MEYKDREHQAAQYIIEDLAARVERERQIEEEISPDKKKEQMKKINEKAKQDNTPLDLATIVLC